jgi:hypothetical protein
MPAILDDDNQLVAIGCGAMEPTRLKLPKGLFAWRGRCSPTAAVS